MVITCHNEVAGLEVLLRDIPPVVDEVVVVDNCSTDTTAAVGRSFGARVIYEPKKGYGNAYHAGFENATSDIIATMDADGMYPLESIWRLVRTMTRQGYDFITTRRIPDRRRGFFSLIRYMGDVALNIVTRVLFRVKLKDSQSGMWVFKRKILESLNITSTGMAMSQELKIEAFLHPDVTAVEIPVLYHDERIGDSKLSLWRDGFGNLGFLFAKWWRDRSTREYLSTAEETTTMPSTREISTTSTNRNDMESSDVREDIHHHSRT